MEPLGKVKRNSLIIEDCAVAVGFASHRLAAVKAVLAGEGDLGVPVGLVEHLEAGSVVVVPLASCCLDKFGPVSFHDLVVEELEL